MAPRKEDDTEDPAISITTFRTLREVATAVVAFVGAIGTAIFLYTDMDRRIEALEIEQKRQNIGIGELKSGMDSVTRMEGKVDLIVTLLTVSAGEGTKPPPR